MPRKSNAVHYREYPRTPVCGFYISFTSDSRMRGKKPEGVTSNKKKVTCMNCLRVLNAPKPKTHYASGDLRLWHTKKSLCGFKFHYMTTPGRLIYPGGNTRKVTCAHCKRMLKKCKKSKKK